MAVDGRRTLYFTDTFSNRVRKVTPSGHIVTVAGTGRAGYSGDGGQATRAALNTPSGMYVDAWGALLVADTFNNCVRRIDLTGTITTVAGTGVHGFGGDGGPAVDAMLARPLGVSVDGSGRILIADKDNHRVRVVDEAGVIRTLAGNGRIGFSGDGGAATEAALRAPSAVGADAAGSIYLADRANGRVRRIDADGMISTVLGGGLLFRNPDSDAFAPSLLEGPYGLFAGSGGVFVADTESSRILRLQTPPDWPRIALQPARILADGRDASTIRIDVPGALPGGFVVLHVLEGEGLLPSDRVALRNDWTVTQLKSLRPGTTTVQAIARTARGDASATASLVVDPVRRLRLDANRFEFPANGTDRTQLLVEQQSLGSGGQPMETPPVHLSVVSGRAVLGKSEFPFTERVTGVSVASTTPGGIRVRVDVEGAFPRFLDLVAAAPLPGQAADAFEYDNEREAATLIRADGATSRRTLHEQADVDWVAFEARPGFRYTVSAESEAEIGLKLHDSRAGSIDGIHELAYTHHGDTETVYAAIRTPSAFAPYALRVVESPDILLRPRQDSARVWAVDGRDGVFVEWDLVDSDGRVHTWDSATAVSFRLLEGTAELEDTVVVADDGMVRTRLKVLRTGDIRYSAAVSDSGSNAVGFLAVLEYDPKVLRFEFFEPIGAMSGAEAILDHREGRVEVAAAILDGQTSSGGGSVGRVRFQIGTLNPGATRLRLVEADVGFGSGRSSVPGGLESGVVEFEGGGEQILSLADYVARLGSAFNSIDGDPAYDAWIDVNRDGRIDIVDLVLYARKLQGN